ncbi:MULTISPECIES: hypothetical protein [Exiguobacterium]|uniref:hypothetical protein n=1 Tax=Exiguobacterium TaxID=33986 RepID=UPI001039C032|nr:MULTISPECIES: hypothetical protein [unclassified Exiguobacterium]TCI67472.1 hypothetical protein EVJ19_12990 [Exiguobacterium sp. IPCI3]TCI76810.1 hypothetical protein EVJ18_12980 [Exiguobacterium sp. IPCH1]TCI78555.1 hypothetical protein EVJ17_12980 [Exiguobacterium sp. IPBC4]
MTKQQRIDEMNRYREQRKRRRDVMFAPVPGLLFVTLLADHIWWVGLGLMGLFASGSIVYLLKEGETFARLSDQSGARMATRNVYRILSGWYVFIVGSVASYKLSAPWWAWILVLGMAMLLPLLYKRFNETVQSADAAQPVRSELATASGLL